MQAMLYDFGKCPQTQFDTSYVTYVGLVKGCSSNNYQKRNLFLTNKIKSASITNLTYRQMRTDFSFKLASEGNVPLDL